MGLLSKLLGGNLNSAVKQVMDAAEQKLKDIEKAEKKPEAAAAQAHESAAVPEIREERSDALWGEIMPKDENQFSFKGTYRAYFEDIFNAEFRRLFLHKGRRKEARDRTDAEEMRRAETSPRYAAGGRPLPALLHGLQ